MNEQIKLLAEQAGLKVESFMTNPPKPFQILGSTEQFEKFAELIVRECMLVGFNAVYEAADDSKAVAVYQNIEKHFGVKE